MKGLLVFFFCLRFFLCHAQYDIRMDTVLFRSADKSVSAIPHAVAASGNQSGVTERINAAILSRFRIHSFDPALEKDFHWKHVRFSSELKDTILYIGFSGMYTGTYTEDVSEAFYFHLRTGHLLQEKTLPFQALFSLEGYFNFLQAHWLPECSKAYTQASSCAGFEPYCSCYDIEMHFNKQEMVLSLTPDCFFQVVKTCTPYHAAAFPLDSLRPYLSEFGKYVLFETAYTQGSPLDRFLFYHRNAGKIPDYHFFTGTVNHKEAIWMALEFTAEGTARGYYRLNNNPARMALTGTFEGNTLVLHEKSKGVVLNTFECAVQNPAVTGNSMRTKFLSATWKYGQTGKVVEIVWKEIMNAR